MVDHRNILSEQVVSMIDKQYAERDIEALDENGGHYIRHVAAMTAEDLHRKSDIAAELAYRDHKIESLKVDVDMWKSCLDRVKHEHETIIQRLESELEKYKRFYVAVTNSDMVVNDEGEHVGYLATNQMLKTVECE